MPYTLKERESIQKAYESLLVDIRPNVNDPQKLKVVEDAYQFSLEKYDGKYLASGKAYLFHLIELARIAVLEVGLGYMSVVAAFLHGITYKEQVPMDYLEERYGKRIATVLKGFDKISALHTERVAYNSDNFRDLFLSLADDMRTVLLKVAHRVYDVRNQQDVSADRLAKYFHEIKYIYIPIVHRLGLYKIKAELEEQLMLYENPEVYHEIKAKIEATEESRKHIAERFLAPIRNRLDSEIKNGKYKFTYQIKWRVKSIPSIYAKMKAQNVPFEKVYDLLAARVIIDCAPKDEIGYCWCVYADITNLYEPVPERMRDWITVPKASGYESLHATVKFDENVFFEVQIRTTRMDEIAEMGQAAHYLYKGDKQSSEDWLVGVRQVLENPELVSLENSYKKNYKSDKIFIFTPEGDLKQLPVGSTVLDFAYEIHTQVGETCSGAKINGRVVPIRHVLANGDKVEIITNKKQSPNADWLNWVATEKSRNRIRRFLKEQELKESELGKGMLHRRLKNWKIPTTEDVIDLLVRTFKTENSLQLYHKIATEQISLADIKHFLTDEMDQKEERVEKPVEQVETIKKESYEEECLSIGEDIKNVNYKLAKCCHPIPGDKVFGFVTNEGNITIHRVNCPNAKSLQDRYGYRIIKVRWNGIENGVSQATIMIIGENKQGLLGKITKVISEDMQVDMQNAMFNTNKKGLFEGKIVVQIPDIESLEKLMDRIKGVDGITEVVRVDDAYAPSVSKY